MAPKYQVELIFDNGTSQNCFDVDVHSGWCGVCDPNATEGHRGHCHQIQGNAWNDNEEEATITTPDKNWGWCSSICVQPKRFRHSLHEAAASKLQVAFVNILGKKDCVGLISSTGCPNKFGIEFKKCNINIYKPLKIQKIL